MGNAGFCVLLLSVVDRNRYSGMWLLGHQNCAVSLVGGYEGRRGREPGKISGVWWNKYLFTSLYRYGGYIVSSAPETSIP